MNKEILEKLSVEAVEEFEKNINLKVNFYLWKK